MSLRQHFPWCIHQGNNCFGLTWCQWLRLIVGLCSHTFPPMVATLSRFHCLIHHKIFKLSVEKQRIKTFMRTWLSVLIQKNRLTCPSHHFAGFIKINRQIAYVLSKRWRLHNQNIVSATVFDNSRIVVLRCVGARWMTRVHECVRMSANDDVNLRAGCTSYFKINSNATVRQNNNNINTLLI